VANSQRSVVVAWFEMPCIDTRQVPFLTTCSLLNWSSLANIRLSLLGSSAPNVLTLGVHAELVLPFNLLSDARQTLCRHDTEACLRLVSLTQPMQDKLPKAPVVSFPVHIDLSSPVHPSIHAFIGSQPSVVFVLPLRYVQLSRSNSSSPPSSKKV